MMRLGLLAGLLLGLPLAAEAATATAALTLTPCRLEHPARMLALPAECGSFTVPENPDQPDGRKIDLFVARVPAISIKKAPDPLFLIAGGPGTSAVDLYTSSAPPFDRVRRDRDIVLVDQRGTGRSNRLDCKYGNDNLFDRIDEVEIGPENVKCRDDLSKKSDLRMYTTSIAVRDLDAVRVALGYERINLYGGSYGTRVAQHYARRYPQATRAVILDGVINPEEVLGPAIAIDAEQALQRILARCKADEVDAAIFVPNCPVCHQSVTLAARHLEANGIPTVVMGCAKDIVEHVGAPRFLFSDFPLGNSAGKPFDLESQRLTLELALKLLESAFGPRTTMQSPLRWSGDPSWKRDYNNYERMPPEELARRRLEFDAQKEAAKKQRENAA